MQTFRAEGGRGCNVTVPFKFEAAALATRRSARAQLAQACNTLRFDDHEIFGDNTDGIGLVSDIAGNAGVALAGRDLLLIGAGGAAAGVLGPLIEARPRRIVVANRSHAARGRIWCSAMRAWAASTAWTWPLARWMPFPALSTWWSTPRPAA